MKSDNHFKVSKSMSQVGQYWMIIEDEKSEKKFEKYQSQKIGNL